MRVLFSFVCASSLFWFGHVALAQTNKDIDLKELPAAVRKTVENRLAGAKIQNIAKENDDGDSSYTITVVKQDEERDFTVSEEGKLRNEEMMLAETPVAVQKAINKQVGTGTLDWIDKVYEDDRVSYEVEFTKKDESESSFIVGTDGKLLSCQVTLQELSPTLQRSVKMNQGTNELVSIHRVSEEDEITYEVNVLHDGKPRDFSIRADGKLLHAQVFLSETAAAVQRTIKDKIGSGKLLRIDRVFELRQGVQPFEVEARKGGKPFNFSVGPKGRFLGMDD